MDRAVKYHPATPPNAMYSIGFDTTGNFDHMRRATAAGIHAVFHPIPAERAVVITGATINATTAGRMPLKIAVRVGFEVIVSGVRNMAMALSLIHI